MNDLRGEFPVLEHVAYLNAGTNGPAPRRGIAAAVDSLREQERDGRAGHAFFLGAIEQYERLRARAAALMGCTPAEVALTGSTTDGVNAVLGALELGDGDEVLTSDEEHPGVLAPLAGLRERRGVRVRVAPFDQLAEAIGEDTRLVACSHVSWISGRVVGAAALAARGVPVLLDGAQGLGAVPVDVGALRCDFYAASGQKWLCGPNGTGYLYVRRERIASLVPAWPGFGTVADPSDPLGAPFQEEARRFDTGFVAPHDAAWALAALELFDEAGWPEIHERAAGLAERLAGDLAGRGVRVAPRGRSTLVSWEVAEPQAEAERLAGAGVVVRDLPGRPYLRASVGAWTADGELERLLELATSGP